MREVSVPASYTIPDDRSAVEIVAELAAEKPNSAMFERITAGGTWETVTTSEFAALVQSVAKGLYAHGIQAGDRVGIFSATRFEWTVFDFAIWSVGAIPVPLYESSSAEQVRWILEDSGATAVIVETARHAATAAAAIAAFSGEISKEISVHVIEEDAVGTFSALGTAVSDADIQARIDAVTADSPATLIYTSGTTGRPKGCVLTHRNLLAEAAGISTSTFADYFEEGKKTLMFLPLAHVLARAVTYAALSKSLVVGLYGDTTTLIEQFAVFKPNLILSVPRVFEKVFNGAQAKAHNQGGLTGKIYDAAADTAIAWSQAKAKGKPGIVLEAKHALFNKLVYSKLQAALGNQCEFAISGGAPLGERLGHFFNGIGVTIYEGYGLTETTAAHSVNTPGQLKVGTVGHPLAGNATRIAEDGEILLGGQVVFREYWNNPEATAAALEDGWFHTGDLGSLDEEGYLSITGRKKEIIVTAGGKNVSPSQLEDRIRGNRLVSQAICVGDQKPFIGVLITIDPDTFPTWKAENGKPADATVADLTNDPDLVAEIDSAVKDANTTVSKAEAIKKFRILPDDFTEDSGEMTPTMKIKRNIVHEKRSAEIEALYVR